MPRDLRMAVGRRVRELRHQRQISQEELAEQADLHRNYVGSVERGERDIGIIALDRLATAWDSIGRPLCALPAARAATLTTSRESGKSSAKNVGNAESQKTKTEATEGSFNHHFQRLQARRGPSMALLMGAVYDALRTAPGVTQEAARPGRAPFAVDHMCMWPFFNDLSDCSPYLSTHNPKVGSSNPPRKSHFLNH